MTPLPDPHFDQSLYQDVTLKRGLAFIVDTVIIAVLTALAVVSTLFTGLLILPLLFAIIGFLYRVLTLTAGSATWGMRLFVIEFRDAKGQRFDFTLALFHTIATVISFGTALLQIISIVLMFASEKGQGLTDHLLGTVAINRPARAF
jgi:uncharacterized RDD family membrane protein YckC